MTFNRCLSFLLTQGSALELPISVMVAFIVGGAS